ncbi:MAG: dihydroxyacetone kinase subunit DhaK [Synergistales bacterium]|jgi:dihydroxyacetone kinase-like protein|nr:dihydroxyacetone kinase subunit DhaK [Synergistales bacterium]MDI9390986.1 dihydroxyacetone kinase subunit DhaK [Synergistota bacterium]
MKKLINSPEDVVSESVEGLVFAHESLLELHPSARVVMRRDRRREKVALISGGGSGHEPLHVGYVGYGMLDAACPGEIFTSPTPDQMYEAAKATDRGQGILFIVKNYTGDTMNFSIAVDLLTAEDYSVEQVVIADDVAVKDSLYTAGRRGVGGTVFAEKIVGAKAEEGASLEELKELCEKVSNDVRSMGVALTSPTVPASGKPTFEIATDEMEIGIGIHGEPGRERVKLRTAKEIVEVMAKAIVEDLPFLAGDQVAVMVNGMGGSPLIELYLVYRELKNYLDKIGIGISRSLVGNYITSLEMQGVSITLLRLDEELKRLWDAPVCTPALRWGM